MCKRFLCIGVMLMVLGVILGVFGVYGLKDIVIVDCLDIFVMVICY